jgi:hypothetical protein
MGKDIYHNIWRVDIHYLTRLNKTSTDGQTVMHEHQNDHPWACRPFKINFIVYNS